MKRRWPKTFAYLKQFEGDHRKPVRGTLRGRALYRSYYEPSDPFYSMYNVGPYTMEEWKAVWSDMGNEISAAVVSQENEKTIIPEHHVMFVALTCQKEAHYLSATLNSSLSRLAIAAYTTTTGISTHVLNNIAIPFFSAGSTLHNRLSALSQECHQPCNGADDVHERFRKMQNEIDEVAAKIWGITDAELKGIQKALGDM